MKIRGSERACCGVSQIPRAARRSRGREFGGRASRSAATMSTTNWLNVVPMVTVLAVIKNRLPARSAGTAC